MLVERVNTIRVDSLEDLWKKGFKGVMGKKVVLVTKKIGLRLELTCQIRLCEERVNEYRAHMFGLFLLENRVIHVVLFHCVTVVMQFQ